MRTVGLKVLKNKLSEHVRLASRGETVLIADRDKVVAELVPPRESRSALVSDAHLADLVRKGFLSPALTAPGRPPAAKAVAKLKDILAELAADRSDR